MPSARAVVTAALVVGAGLLAGCGDGGGDVADDRAAQVGAAAREAGLADDVADVLALAARGATATFQVTYAGTQGAGLMVSQAPPNHRIDVLAGDVIVESTLVRGGVGYRCERAEDTGDLECERRAGDLDAPGAFTEEAISRFTSDLAASAGTLDLSVEERTIAATEATCLITGPKAGTPLDGNNPGVDTICLSPEGAQLLVDSEGDRVVADRYTTEVPGGTFDV